jgi:digeranylgeranylglycerophospholipid reductase
VLGAFLGGVSVCGLIPKLSAGGLVLVGDAARLIDPATGEGILNGMISGRIAGNVIADCCGKGDLSADALSQYDREIERQLGPALDRNYRLKEYLRRASDTKLDWTFRALKAIQVESIPVTKILKEIYTPASKRAARFIRLLIP